MTRTLKFAVCLAALAAALSGAGAAFAHDPYNQGLPYHSWPSPTWCNTYTERNLWNIPPGFASINSGMSIVDPMPDAGISIIYGDGTSADAENQYVYFRIIAARWNGSSWDHFYGNWLRKLSGEVMWKVQSSDGTWYVPISEGDIAESRILVPARAKYWVGVQIYWGAFQGATRYFPGLSHFEWYKQIAC